MKLRFHAVAAAAAAVAFLGGIAACSGTASGPSDAASGASFGRYDDSRVAAGGQTPRMPMPVAGRAAEVADSRGAP